MARIDRATSALLNEIGLVVRTTRTGLRWPQRRLALESGCSQSVIARIETPPVHDRTHARIVGAVARRLRRAGYLVATEVAFGGNRWRGFIDVLAMHPDVRLLLVIEAKSVIDDIGRTDRQLGAYVDSAWAAARLRGWRPRAVTGLLVVLATDENDQRLRSHRELIDIAFPLRARDLMTLVSGISSRVPPRGERGIAMVDPGSRRRAWLSPTTLEGRRTPAPYADTRAFLGSLAGIARRPPR